MKRVSLLRCRDTKQAISFYTGIPDYKLKYPEAGAEDWVADLINDDAE